MTILCYGEIGLDIYVALDQLPTVERSAWSTEDFENIGGAAANSALWLANWEVPTRLAGHDAGADREGAVLLEALAGRPHLDSSFISSHAGYRTPRCQCLVTPDGERSFITHWAREMRLCPPSAAMFADARWLNLDMSGPLPQRLQAAEMAAARGIPIVVNDIYERDNPLLPLLHTLVLSAAVIRSKYDKSAPLALARALGAAGDCNVIVTDSGRELTILTPDGAKAAISPPRVRVLDSTGAGDVFKSGLLYGLRQGLPLLEAARWGAAAGALICQVAGVTKTLAPLDALQRLAASGG